MSDFKWRSLEVSLGVAVEIPTRGVELPVTSEVKATPTKQETKKRMHVVPRKAVRADDPYL